MVWFGLNLFNCNIITMGLGTISKTYVALSLYNNLQLFHMQIKSHIGVYEYKDSK